MQRTTKLKKYTQEHRETLRDTPERLKSYSGKKTKKLQIAADKRDMKASYVVDLPNVAFAVSGILFDG